MDCIFCGLKENIILEKDLALAVEDRYPAVPGHSLIIPRRHIVTLDEATEAEVIAIFGLIREVKELLRSRLGADGFNIGINEGAAAGQTIMHLHLHILPRFQGDVADPRGGVRKVVPNRSRYFKTTGSKTGRGEPDFKEQQKT